MQQHNCDQCEGSEDVVTIGIVSVISGWGKWIWSLYRLWIYRLPHIEVSLVKDDRGSMTEVAIVTVHILTLGICVMTKFDRLTKNLWHHCNA